MFKINFIHGGCYVSNSKDNSELHDLLNDACVNVEEVLGQETWTLSDGSYITRDGDEYWTGNDIDEFKLVSCQA